MNLKRMLIGIGFVASASTISSAFAHVGVAVQVGVPSVPVAYVPAATPTATSG